jgi:predicted regulator of Ras-like GTPase activity (Roadblock/LC7/MglB family)
LSKKISELEAVLRELEKNCDVNGSAIVTTKGQMICSLLPHNTHEKAVSAMAAALQSIGVRVGTELNAGLPKSIHIDGSESSLFVRGQGPVLLIGMAPYDSEIGLIDFELNRAVVRTENIMGRVRNEK